MAQVTQSLLDEFKRQHALGRHINATINEEGQLLFACDEITRLCADLARVTKERDEALADAVRLRAAIDNIAAVWDDPHSSLVAELRAIQDAQALAATPANALGKIEARVLREAAIVIELYDDATMKNDYMLCSTDCAEIIEALADAKEKA